MPISLKTKGFICVLSGPSGTGKSTLAKAVAAKDNNIKLSLSVTTRKPRAHERNGIDYFFKTKEEFQKLVEEKKFLEYAKVYGHSYGTLKDIELATVEGVDMLATIDWQGVLALKGLMPKQVILIFILPPSLTILKQRLYNRNQDSDSELSKRMKVVEEEIFKAKEYDYVVINENFDNTTTLLHAIVQAERANQPRLDLLNEFLGQLSPLSKL
jgi:guanylate kinase